MPLDIFTSLKYNDNMAFFMLRGFHVKAEMGCEYNVCAPDMSGNDHVDNFPDEISHVGVSDKRSHALWSMDIHLASVNQDRQVICCVAGELKR